MYFIVTEVRPVEGSAVAAKYSEGAVSCWVRTDAFEFALERGRKFIEESGQWSVVRTIECFLVSEEDYEPDDPYLKYFQQAIVDEEVCVIYAVPREESQS